MANVPVTNVADTLPEFILPVTDNDPNMPRLVMFGCEFVVNVPVK